MKMHWWKISISVIMLVLILGVTYSQTHHNRGFFTSSEMNILRQYEDEPLHIIVDERFEHEFEPLITFFMSQASIQVEAEYLSSDEIDYEHLIHTDQIPIGRYYFYGKISQDEQNLSDDVTIGSYDINITEIIQKNIQNPSRNYSYVEYETREAMLDGFESGDVDYLLLDQSDLYIVDNEHLVAKRLERLNGKGDTASIYFNVMDRECMSIFMRYIHFYYKYNRLDGLDITDKITAAQSIVPYYFTEEEMEYIHEASTIRVGLRENDPYIYRDGNKIYGGPIRVMDALAHIWGVELEYIIGESEELNKALDGGALDFVWREIEEDVNSSGLMKKQVVEVPYVWITHDIGNIDENYVDYLGNKVGIYNDSLLVQQLVSDERTKQVSVYDDYHSLLDAVTQGDLDYGIMPMPIYLGESGSYPILQLDIDEPNINAASYGIEMSSHSSWDLIIQKTEDILPFETFFFEGIKEIPEPLTFYERFQLWIIIGVIGTCLVLGYIVRYFSNAKEMRRLNEMFQRDNLTFLPNRYGISTWLMKAHKKHNQGYVAVIRIYGLSVINNRFGHEVGDKVSTEVSQLLMGFLRENNILGHIEGNEFFYGTVDEGEDDFVEGIKKIKNQVDMFLDAHPMYNSLSVSLAYASFPEHGSDYNDLYKHCDYTLTYGEEVFGNTSFIHGFSYEIYDRFILEQEHVEAIKKGIEADEFLLYIQPQVKMPEEKIIGGELLARWNHPTKGIMSPGFFMETIEKYGLIKEFDYYILNKSIAQVKKWQSQGEFFKVSINITTETFIDYYFIERLTQWLEQTSIDPSYVYLEITEDMTFGDLDEAKAAIEKVHTLGLKVALDDFGKGYSSLSYLQKLSIDALKLDKQFVDSIHVDMQSKEIYQVVSYLATVLNIPLIVEGVETREQLDQVKETKGLIIQGYYYGRPTDANNWKLYD